MTDWEDLESGPFCRHWGDPSDCDEMCKCGHECHSHWLNGECRECDCDGFEDDPDA